MTIDVRKYDVRVYHLLLKLLPGCLSKSAWRRLGPVIFAIYLFYARRLRPVLFPTPSERALEYSWVLGNLHKERKRILNVGCGDSLLSGELARRGYECVDIDLNCCPLNRKVPIFLQADIMNLPFRDSSFDQIIAISSLEHIEGDDGVLMKELSRVLKEGGFLFVTMPVGEHEGACSMTRLGKLLHAANRLNTLPEEYCLAQGRKWQIVSKEKVQPYVNKAKVIIRLALTKGVDSAGKEAKP